MRKQQRAFILTHYKMRFIEPMSLSDYCDATKESKISEQSQRLDGDEQRNITMQNTDDVDVLFDYITDRAIVE
jgi:hypothetical protein